MKNNLILLNSLILVLLASCFQVNVHAETKASSNSITQMQKDILLYINHYRVQHRLPPLKMNNAISLEATIHSKDMVTHRIPFGHLGFSERIKHLYATIKRANGGAENVACNYKNAEIVSREWIKSPGHRRNIMGNYNLTGIGIAYDKQGKICYTQIFIRTI